MGENKKWKWIPGYRGRYAVSRAGLVASIKRTGPRLLKIRPDREGYPRVHLSKNGVAKSVFVHHAVLYAFVGPMPEGMEACHRNGVKSDNRLSNLYWGTHLENMRDRDLHGKTQRGESHANAKLNNSDVIAIRRAFKNGDDQTKIADRFGVSRRSVQSVLTGETWGHV